MVVLMIILVVILVFAAKIRAAFRFTNQVKKLFAFTGTRSVKVFHYDLIGRFARPCSNVF
jgi:hypothetical protein